MWTGGKGVARVRVQVGGQLDGHDLREDSRQAPRTFSTPGPGLDGTP
jgi:hypothetical protein